MYKRQIRPYPRELAVKCTLNDGTIVALRPIRPEDANMEQAFVAGLSERSKRMRFMQSLQKLPPDWLARFTDIDYEREMAFVAVHRQGDRDIELGVARYVACPDGESGEFAVVVGDKWQGRGLGTKLLQVLVAAARRQGLKQIIGQVLPDNIGMLAMCRKLGFQISPWATGTDARIVSLTLQDKQGT